MLEKLNISKRCSSIRSYFGTALPINVYSETQSDQWIRHDMEFDVKGAKQLGNRNRLKQSKASAYPELTYESLMATLMLILVTQFKFQIVGFTNMLLLEARIFEQKLSFSSEKN